MYQARAFLWGLATLGLLMHSACEWKTATRAGLGLTMLLQGGGLCLLAPGVALQLQLGLGYPATLAAKWAAWLTTLLALEPLLRWVERPIRRQPPQPGQVQRRTLLLAGTSLAGTTLLGGYAAAYEPNHIGLVRKRLYLPDLPPSLEGLKIVLMSDWHCSPQNRPARLIRGIRLANQCRPHLVLLPGDFTSLSGRFFSEAAELASQLQTVIPGAVFLSWGNHDYWHGIEPGLELMPQAGCHILTNRKLLINPKRELAQEGRGLWICGLDDLWAGKPDLAGTLQDLPPDQPRLVMSHNPDLAEEQGGPRGGRPAHPRSWEQGGPSGRRPGPRVDLMLSGHTHGGQVRIPTLGAPIVPSRYGSKYAQGWVQGPHYPVYVSRGMGTSGIPVRFLVPPEVTLFELYRGPQVKLSEA